MGIKYYMTLALGAFLFSFSLTGVIGYLGNVDTWLFATGLVVSVGLGWHLLRGTLSLV